ncbi:MAG: RhuM family protein [Allgaiera sp.]|jgi:hypothetical protein|nr:RhuM family protein [Allgaiera sp.]
MSELVLYTSNDGRTRLDLRIDGQTVWLSQLEIAELFQTTKQNVSLHARNIFEDGELNPGATVKDYLTVQTEGKREVRRPIQYYNLDLILAIGYRVRSPRGVQFRQWASTHLKEYLVKGFVMDDERLKNPGGWDYFDELLARIREIRASEKRFYQKVRDLFVLSSDYQAREKETQLFFAEVQNKLLFAVAGKTAAELIVDRVVANHMWNQDWFTEADYDNDELGRIPAGAGFPGKSSADWGWVQHMHASLNDKGRAAVVLDTGAASRGSGNAGTNKEKAVRQWFVDHDLIESVLYLPENLFCGGCDDLNWN